MTFSLLGFVTLTPFWHSLGDPNNAAESQAGSATAIESLSSRLKQSELALTRALSNPGKQDPATLSEEYNQAITTSARTLIEVENLLRTDAEFRARLHDLAHNEFDALNKHLSQVTSSTAVSKNLPGAVQQELQTNLQKSATWAFLLERYLLTQT